MRSREVLLVEHTGTMNFSVIRRYAILILENGATSPNEVPVLVKR